MRVLAATDGSPGAGAAVRFAAWLATAFERSSLDVLLVGDAGTVSIGQGGGSAQRAGNVEVEAYRRWASRALDRAARSAAALGIEARCRYVGASLAPVAAVIARTAEALRADWIVVGSAGRGAAGRALFGSVARRLILLTRLPVVVVPRPVAARRGQTLSVVAATDGSRGSAAAVRCAASAVRRARRGRLEIVAASTLRRDLLIGFPAAVLAFAPYKELRKSEVRALRRTLEQGVRLARGRGVRARARMLESRSIRPVADRIAAEARRARAQLTAVGTEGHGAIEAWAMGSVTQRLLAVSRRPVLVVRPPSRRVRR